MWAGQGKLYVGCSVMCINYACIGCMYTINVSLKVTTNIPSRSIHFHAHISLIERATPILMLGLFSKGKGLLLLLVAG